MKKKTNTEQRLVSVVKFIENMVHITISDRFIRKYVNVPHSNLPTLTQLKIHALVCFVHACEFGRSILLHQPFKYIDNRIHDHGFNCFAHTTT